MLTFAHFAYYIQEMELLSKMMWTMNSTQGNDRSEIDRLSVLLEKAQANPNLQHDPLQPALTNSTTLTLKMGAFPFVFNDGRIITDADIYEGLQLLRDVVLPPLKQGIEKMRPGARREFYINTYNIIVGANCGAHFICHTTERNAKFMHALRAAECGEDNVKYVDSVSRPSSL